MRLAFTAYCYDKPLQIRCMVSELLRSFRVDYFTESDIIRDGKKTFATNNRIADNNVPV